MSFSYGGTAVFPFEAEIPRFPEGRSARISIHVSYLACKDVCIPGEGTAEITLPYEVAPKPSADAELVSNAIVNVPEVADTTQEDKANPPPKCTLRRAFPSTRLTSAC